MTAPRVATQRPPAANHRTALVSGRPWRVLTTVAVWLVAAGTALAQDPSKEFWPEVDTWWRVSPAWRLSLFVPISENLDTHYREGNVIPQVDVTFGQTPIERRLADEDRVRKMKAFMLRGGYFGGKSLDDAGEAYSEHSALAELHLRIPFKGGFLLSHRFRTDFRFLGDDAEFSTRYRYRVMLEREFAVGRTSFVPYVNGEGYYDSRYEMWNRYRLIAGGSLSWSPRTALEANVTYQYDSKSSTKELLAFNIILHIFFDTSR